MNLITELTYMRMLVTMVTYACMDMDISEVV